MFWNVLVEFGNYTIPFCPGTMVTVGMSLDGFQTLSSDGTILSVQQVMMGDHSEDDMNDSGDEDSDTHLSSANLTGLGLDASD